MNRSLNRILFGIPNSSAIYSSGIRYNSLIRCREIADSLEVLSYRKKLKGNEFHIFEWFIIAWFLKCSSTKMTICRRTTQLISCHSVAISTKLHICWSIFCFLSLTQHQISTYLSLNVINQLCERRLNRNRQELLILLKINSKYE